MRGKSLRLCLRYEWVESGEVRVAEAEVGIEHLAFLDPRKVRRDLSYATATAFRDLLDRQGERAEPAS